MLPCYECKNKGTVPGSCHLRCNHPDVVDDSPIKGLMSILGATDMKSESFGITANPHGVKKGWFSWPYNFDPVWGDKCDKFKTIKEEMEEGK